MGHARVSRCSAPPRPQKEHGGPVTSCTRWGFGRTSQSPRWVPRQSEQQAAGSDSKTATPAHCASVKKPFESDSVEAKDDSRIKFIIRTPRDGGKDKVVQRRTTLLELIPGEPAGSEIRKRATREIASEFKSAGWFQ